MLHVQDAIAANIFCMNYENSFNGKYFDVGTGDNISLNEMKEVVWKHNPNVKFNHVGQRSGEVDVTKALTLPLMVLGFKTKISIKQGLESCFTNLREN